MATNNTNVGEATANRGPFSWLGLAKRYGAARPYRPRHLDQSRVGGRQDATPADAALVAPDGVELSIALPSYG